MTDADRAPSRADRTFWIGLAAITLIALVWRVGYVLWQIGRLELNGDAAYYHWQATDIAAGRWFIDPIEYRELGRVTASAFHPPAYSLYLATVSKAIGTSETAHRLASTLLGAGAVLVTGVLARRLFRSSVAGWTAAALAAVYAHLWINDEMLMSESMYVLTITIAVLLAYRFWDAPRTTTAIAMGAGVAVAALSRAEALALVPLLTVPFALLSRTRPVRERIRLAAVTCAATAVVLAPWFGYNLTRFEHPALMSNGLGSVLIAGNCDYTEPATGREIGTYDGPLVGYWQIKCKADLDAKIDRQFGATRASELHDELGRIPGTDREFYGDESTHEVAWRAIAVEEMRDHERELPRVVVLRVLRMWDLFRTGQNIEFNAALEGRGRWQSRLATYQYFPMLLLAGGGLVLLRRRRVPVLPFIAVAATVTLAAAMTFGITRYRAPVDAMLPVLAGGALAAVYALVTSQFAPSRRIATSTRMTRTVLQNSPK
jgi:4-amino-4-deoxy-L-arabinose transferase-like glycosyltransferase